MWIGAWIGVDRTGSEWSGSEWSGSECGSRRERIGASLVIGAGFEWLRRGVSGSELQRSWLRGGASGSKLWWAWLRRGVSGEQCVWEQSLCVWGLVRACACFRKSIEAKITTKSNFSRFLLIFRSNWNCFQFDRIFQRSQTRDFPEIDFRKSNSVETNGA